MRINGRFLPGQVVEIHWKPESLRVRLLCETYLDMGQCKIIARKSDVHNIEITSNHRYRGSITRVRSRMFIVTIDINLEVV